MTMTPSFVQNINSLVVDQCNAGEVTTFDVNDLIVEKDMSQESVLKEPGTSTRLRKKIKAQ